jgi:hypothetical protein
VAKVRDFPNGAPFPPIIFIDIDRPFAKSDLLDVLSKQKGRASICIRSLNGHEQRGGYFFHFELRGSLVALFLFDGTEKTELTIDQATDLVNHCTGSVFSEEALQLFQQKLNFKEDS